MSSSRKRIAQAIGLGVAASGLAVAPAAASPAGTGLVISEVYGGGGATTGSPSYAADYVELYNPTSSAISLGGLSLQYRSATYTTTSSVSVAALSGSVPANRHFLVQVSTGSVGPALSNPDLVTSSTLNMSGTNGQVLLANGTTAITTTGDLAGNSGLLDMVGYGSTPTSFEKARTGTALTTTTSVQRNATGADTDDNSADFATAAPAPENSGAGGGGTDPGTVDKTIAEIQGTGAASPLVGQTVHTTGIVTAKYPAGGLNGIYVQTEGTGGATDATPGAWDAIFVFGANSGASTVSLGDKVDVTGPVSEFNGTTEITPATGGVTVATGAGTPVTPLAAAYPTTEADREAHEGELLAPTNNFTVTNTYSTNQYAEIGLATGDKPLIAPTEIKDAQDSAGIAEVTADNAARAVTLDDGASINFLGADANKDIPLPWLSTTNPIRVGARATFTGPVILEYRNSVWKFQPTQQVTGEGAGVATFQNTRTPSPENVGGDIRLATFNVLNYFPTTAEEFDAGAGSCTFYDDRDGNHITANTCTPNGPRGAANDASLARQQVKIVTAINKLGASIVSLEELENSVQFGKDRDFAIGELVDALNVDAGAGTWAFVPSPPADQRPAANEEDVIRTGFIYKPADVVPVGESKILRDEVNFDNAREPLAQAFKRKGAPDSDDFAVIVNHFKSKGSGTDDGTGQGNANPDRIGQANALTAFADSFAQERGTDKVLLTGDFNSYSEEDPMQVLYGAGYTAIDSDNKDEETYSFSGLSGSLDHVLANDAALGMVTGADVWNINSGESLAFEYSRYNYNATDFYAPDQFRASDHDPEIVGLDLDETVEDVQILATNDFHGRLTNNSNAEAGAAVLAGAVKQLRAEDPDTVFAAAGDLIGASTFESFIQNDKPTIDALNEAGLEVSAVGNHELDKGYDDLMNRVMAKYDEQANPQGGAEWKYIASNLKLKATGDPAVPASWIKDFGDVEVGFVGAVTEDLPSLVSPKGIEQLEVTDIVESANESADDLKAEGADVIVLLVHEGATSTSLAAATDNSAFGQIVNGVDANIDAIVSGHTHLAYNHAVTVPEWVTEGRDVTTRPVVSAGQYGMALNKLVFSVDRATGEVVAKTQGVLNLETCTAGCTGSSPTWTPNYPVDAATKAIVDDAVAKAEVLGAKPLGDIAGAFNRAKLADPTKENRGGESTLGNLVAEVQRWATETPEAGAAQIAFMNPGGLRQDLTGTVADGYPETVTYKQAAVVQPFANTLVNMDLTGADIKSALEQQWQRDGSGNVPSRPFLRLGISKGFTYTYDPAKPEGSRVTGMWLNGEPIAMDRAYSVTVNSFLASGGDNFRAFTKGTGTRDTGKIDLQAMVDYMAEFAGKQPLTVDYTQRSVGVSFPADAPASYEPGGQVEFKLSSLAFSTAADKKDSQMRASLGDNDLGVFDVDNTIGSEVFDEYGKASVTVTLPSGTPAGKAVLTLTGLTTGTKTEVPVQVDPPAPTPSSVTATAGSMTYGTDGRVDVTVTPDTATGTVRVLDGTTVLGEGTLSDGHASVTIPGDALEPGSHDLTVSYLGDSRTAPSEGDVTVQVAKATSATTAAASPSTVKVKKGTSSIAVTVTADGVTPTGTVEAFVDGASVDSASLTNGAATLEVGPFDSAGTKTVEIRYSGDESVAASQGSTTIVVTKAKPRLTVTHSPGAVKAGTTHAALLVAVKADGAPATGWVQVDLPGAHDDRVVKLEDGVAKLKLPLFQRAGEKSVVVHYNGNAAVEAGDATEVIEVVRK